MTRAEKTIVELEKQGWQFDRKATIKGYYSAGHIGTMETRNGYDYIRVYDGTSKKHKTQRLLVQNSNYAHYETQGGLMKRGID